MQILVCRIKYTELLSNNKLSSDMPLIWLDNKKSHFSKLAENNSMYEYKSEIFSY